MSDYGHWDTSIVGEFYPLDYYGFVYLATNIKTGKRYIGRKSLWSFNSRLVKRKDGAGTKKVKCVNKSNWCSYTTSSAHVNAAIKSGEQFTFQILSLHKSKSSLSYAEIEQLIFRNTLIAVDSSGHRLYYNNSIQGTKSLPVDKLPPELIRNQKTVKKEP